MSKQKLFDDNFEEEVSLKTDNEYAKKYNKWREKEELHKLEQKYGSKTSEGGSSSDSEDDEPPEISEETEAQFLKTLSLLKTKDPRIYEPTFKCFEETEKAPEKAKTLMFDDDDDDDDIVEVFGTTKKAEILENNETPGTDMGSKRNKIKDYLKGQTKHIDNELERDLAPLKALWEDPKLSEGEAFLRDYILNKPYLEEGSAGEAADKLRDDEELEQDEQRVEEQGKFERAYNFRFEEPDQDFLKRYPRTMNYVRPKDERRKRKRAEVRSRKEEAKERKMQEIARLKALKLKEIQEKIGKIKHVSGNDNLELKDEDLNEDFDPEAHDRRMREMFDEQYYGDVDDHKPEFPELDDELEIENWDNYEPEQHRGEENDVDDEGPHCEDEDFNMDADYDPKNARENLLDEIKKTLKKRKNRKKKSKLAQILEKEKPKFIPSVDQKTYDQYMEEYYKMDCEDIIGGDLQTRFKYRKSEPNDYGLSVEEILLADDGECEKWVPLKRVVSLRAHHVERGDVRNYRQKGADLQLKRQLLPSLFRDLPEDPEIVVPIEDTKKEKKKKKKKNKKKNLETTGSNETANLDQESNVDQNNDVLESIEDQNNTELEKPKKKKHKKRKVDESDTLEAVPGTSATNELEHNKNHNIESLKNENNKDSEKPKKKKNKKRNKVEEEQQEVEQEAPEDNSLLEQSKKRKKRSIDGFVVEDAVNAEPSQESTELTQEKKNKKGKHISSANTDTETKKGEESSTYKDKNLKRKANFAETVQPSNKKKKNNNFKQNGEFKNKGKALKSKGPINPLVNLSDERLKAFGLNPKKYKNFLHFKKY